MKQLGAALVFIFIVGSAFAEPRPWQGMHMRQAVVELGPISVLAVHDHGRWVSPPSNLVPPVPKGTVHTMWVVVVPVTGAWCRMPSVTVNGHPERTRGRDL